MDLKENLENKKEKKRERGNILDGEFIAILGCFIGTWSAIGGLYYKVGRIVGILNNRRKK